MMKGYTDKEHYIVELFSKHYVQLRNMCLNRVKGRSELYDFADDAVQEAFIMLHEKYSRLKDHPNIDGWLFETCKYRLILFTH